MHNPVNKLEIIGLTAFAGNTAWKIGFIGVTAIFKLKLIHKVA